MKSNRICARESEGNKRPLRQRAAKTISAVALLLISVAAGAQSGYEPTMLRELGLSLADIRAIRDIQAESAEELRRLQADLQIKKAELARLLVDRRPDMDEIERNVQESAQIEAQIRLNEIERELAIRDAVGIETWRGLVQAAADRRAAAERELGISERAREGLQTLRELLAERREELRAGMMRLRDYLDEHPALRDELEEIDETLGQLDEILRNN